MRALEEIEKEMELINKIDSMIHSKDPEMKELGRVLAYTEYKGLIPNACGTELTLESFTFTDAAVVIARRSYVLGGEFAGVRWPVTCSSIRMKLYPDLWGHDTHKLENQ